MYPNQPSPQGNWPNQPPTTQAPPGWSPQPPNGQYTPRQGQPQNQVSRDYPALRCMIAKTLGPFLLSGLASFSPPLAPPAFAFPLTIHSVKMAAIDPSLSSEPTNTNMNQQIPPITQPVAQGSPMQTLQPQHPDHYRSLPPPQQLYAPPYQPHQQMQYPPPQPAPRQRTAIACRYCRRRKVRAMLTRSIPPPNAKVMSSCMLIQSRSR